MDGFVRHRKPHFTFRFRDKVSRMYLMDYTATLVHELLIRYCQAFPFIQW